MAGMESLTKVIITLLIFFPFSVTASSDTLRQGDRLNSSSFLSSANQLFKLGFFTAEKYSGHSYLAIWYNSDPYTLPVWIGNRDTEIHHNSCVLAIDGAGNLIIADNVGKRIELYSAPSGINTTATLLNTGNLIVREVKSNESVLWQSFDYPSDTLLPGMKLRVNHRTSKKWTLTSWWNGEVGVSGAFTMEWDPIGQGLIVRRRGKNFWTTGVLGDKGFEFLDTNTNMLYKFRNVTSEDVDYLSYSLRDEESRRPVSGWRLDDEGSIHEVTGLQISDGSLCYGYKNDFNKGCQLWQQPDECRYQYQSFQKRSGRIGAQQIDRVGNLSFSDCKANCWDDCACFGFQFDENTTSCTFYRGNQSQFYQDLSGDPPQRYLLTDDPAQQPTTGVLSFHGHSGRKWIWIVIPAVSAFLLLVFGCLCYLRRRKIKLNGPHDDVTDRYMDSSELENGENKSNNLRVFSFRDIIAATNDFSPENELGKGGFGRVYKGKLLNGTEIAIKRLSERSSQGVEEFKNELILIAKLQHVNLVRLIGCCIHGDEKMLIYEYMPNKSLDYFLFDPIRKEQLAWQRRFNIIEGIAQGLLYLHKYSRLKIIHRDLKASNILLDDQMNPKISDFGMARIFKQNVLEANTKRVVGTYGYMAPEYAMKGMFSIKSDVFSFGVLILEIVSGQRTNSFRQIDGPLTLIEHAWELWNKDAALELMDPMLTHSCTKQLLRCVHVALLCVQDHAVDRPTSPDVISMLTNDSIALPLPKKPAFVFGKRVDEGGSNKRMLEKCSVNELSFSLEVPR